MSKLKGYIASHFFDRGGYLQTEELATALEKEFPHIDWYVPHRNDGINNKKDNDAIIDDIAVYTADQGELLQVDILIANLDGVEIDSGASGEIMAMAMRNEIDSILMHEDIGTIIGYTTDMRRNKTDKAFLGELKDLLDDSRYEDALIKMENHKENFLYRNIMITGAVNKWGKMINGYATNNNYIDDIIEAVREWEESREE